MEKQFGEGDGYGYGKSNKEDTVSIPGEPTPFDQLVIDTIKKLGDVSNLHACVFCLRILSDDSMWLAIENKPLSDLPIINRCTSNNVLLGTKLGHHYTAYNGPTAVVRGYALAFLLINGHSLCDQLTLINGFQAILGRINAV